MQQIINPIAVELDDTARLMRIRWDDGHLGEWRWTTLRRACDYLPRVSMIASPRRRTNHRTTVALQGTKAVDMPSAATPP